MTSGNLACVRRNAHTPHGTCPGTAPEFPSEKVEQVTDGYGLTRAEDAYAHLASFKRGDLVDVAGSNWHASATVVEAQRDGWNLEAAYLVIEGPEVSRAITVRDLTHSRITITSRAAQNS